MKTADLTGALLDFWTARAEGVPADQLEIRPVQRPDPRTPDMICVLRPPTNGLAFRPGRVDPSTNWALAGPLVLEYKLDLLCQSSSCWHAVEPDAEEVEGDTPLIAICRAVVRAAFGDEVEDLPCE